jgi:hypothetical protein
MNDRYHTQFTLRHSLFSAVAIIIFMMSTLNSLGTHCLRLRFSDAPTISAAVRASPTNTGAHRSGPFKFQ